MLTAVSGVLSQSGKPVYVWERYSVAYKSVITEVSRNVGASATTQIAIGQGHSFSAETGIYTLTDYSLPRIYSLSGKGMFWVVSVSGVEITGTTVYFINNVTISGSVASFAMPYYYTSASTKGSYIDTVESEDPSAYPTNGVQNGYWYVQIA